MAPAAIGVGVASPMAIAPAGVAVPKLGVALPMAPIAGVLNDGVAPPPRGVAPPPCRCEAGVSSHLQIIHVSLLVPSARLTIFTNQHTPVL